MLNDLTCLSDEELIRSLRTLAGDERGRLVCVLRQLAEMDRRRLAHRRGFQSLFDYCVRELRYAEGEAARRVHAARAAAKYPRLYRAIGRGLLSLSAVSLLAPHLRWNNHRRIIRAALGRNTREVERIVASLAGAQNPPERVRFLGAAAPKAVPQAGECPDSGSGSRALAAGARGEPASAAEPRPGRAGEDLPPGAMVAAPETGDEAAAMRAPQRVQFSFSADESLLAAVERAKDFLRNKYPRPGFEEVFVEAVGALLDRLDRGRRQARRRRGRGVRHAEAAAGQAGDPGAATRRRAIPGWVKDEVWRRDGGRCSFVGLGGRRCGATRGLEYDHVQPWARGGRSDDPANIRILCAGHNGLEARRVFGDESIDAAIERSSKARAIGSGA